MKVFSFFLGLFDLYRCNVLFTESIYSIISEFIFVSILTSFWEFHSYWSKLSLSLSIFYLTCSRSYFASSNYAFCDLFVSAISNFYWCIRDAKSSATVILSDIESFKSSIYRCLWEITLSYYINLLLISFNYSSN